MKRIWVICLCLVIFAGCGNGKNLASSATNNDPSLSRVETENDGLALSSDSPTASANPSSSPVTTNSSSISASASPTSETKNLLFAEDNTTKAIFHIGMTREQVKQTLSDNQMQLEQNDYGYSDEYELMHSLGFSIVGGIKIYFGARTDLLCMVGIRPVSKTQLFNPYLTQKGLKISDTVETVIKLYGEPLKQVNYGDDINGLGVAYYYDPPINLDDYYNEIASMHKSSIKDSRGAYLRINISQSEGNNFNKVVSIIYADKANF